MLKFWCGQAQASVARAWNEAEQTGDSCRGVQPGFGVKSNEKATGFVRGSERIKEAVERGGAMVPGHRITGG